MPQTDPVAAEVARNAQLHARLQRTKPKPKPAPDEVELTALLSKEKGQARFLYTDGSEARRNAFCEANAPALVRIHIKVEARI